MAGEDQSSASFRKGTISAISTFKAYARPLWIGTRKWLYFLVVGLEVRLEVGQTVRSLYTSVFHFSLSDLSDSELKLHDGTDSILSSVSLCPGHQGC